HNDASLLHFVPLQALLSFPTRRSSDLGGRGLFGKPPGGEDAARERPGGGGRPGRTEARRGDRHRRRGRRDPGGPRGRADGAAAGDRKSTRLNSSHVKSSYAVFCLKKQK